MYAHAGAHHERNKGANENAHRLSDAVSFDDASDEQAHRHPDAYANHAGANPSPYCPLYERSDEKSNTPADERAND